MMHRIFFTWFLLFSACLGTAAARTGGVSGTVSDEVSKPVPFASVLLLRATDSALIKTELTDEKGEYHLTPVADGSYVIKIVLSGYQTYVSEAISINGNNAALPPIILAQKTAQLKEVAITGQKPFVEIHADKLVVNVENSIVNAGASVLEVLSRAPGVTVDNNDRISLKGKPGVNVMINGKIQPMSKEDLANLLKSMPSNSVENIEIISNPSAKYDAAGTAGIINIRMKKDKKIGLNGSVNATYAQGVYGKANAGFNMNYRNKKVNVFASYNHSHRQGFNHLTLDRNFYTDGVFAGAYIQDNNYLYNIVGDLGNIGVDYYLSSKTIIGATVGGDNTRFRRDGRNFSDIIDSATRQPLTNFTTINNAPNNWHSYTFNANLRHTFDSTGRSLAVDADYATYPSSGNQYFITDYSDPALASFVLKGDLAGITQIRSFKADYGHPLKNNAKFEAGIKTSYVTSDNDMQFSLLVDSAYKNDTSRTNHFIYKENINAAYVNYSREWDKWSTQLGLRTEQTIANGEEKVIDSSFDRNYMQLFPSFAVQRHINKSNDLGITLSRRIERPNYEQLNPFKYFLDPTTFKAGYPYLLPALSYSAELSHVYKQKLITSFNYSYTQSPIIEVIQPSTTEEKVTIQTTKNLTSMAYYGISGAYQFKFAKWWNNTTNINVFYSRYTGDIAGTNLNDGKVAYNFNTTNSFILSPTWSAELGGYYEAPQIYGYMHLKTQWMLNAGIQKNLFNKQATVRLNATDIFWHGYPRATSIYTDYVESFVAKRDTRQVSLSLTWRFGKRTVPPSQRHRGGAEDEKRRVGGQTG
jgi:hypothetical protein